MNTRKFILIAAAALTLVSCGNGATAQKPVMGPDSTLVYAPAKPLVDSVSYYLGVNFGMMLKNYGFEGLDYSKMVEGMKDMVASTGIPGDSTFADQFKMDPNEMNNVINGYLQQKNDYDVAVNKVAETKFLAEKEKEEGVMKTPSGLLYKILVPGGDKPAAQDTVFVHYKGTTPEGKVFDEVKPEAESARFLLTRVIKGWNEGLQLLGEGGKAIFYIPSSLAYGDRGTGDIKPSTPLTFEVTLDSLRHYVPQAPAAK
jgi:FKBP-type peptidyl-prolyl cis-trans isomerase